MNRHGERREGASGALAGHRRRAVGTLGNDPLDEDQLVTVRVVDVREGLPARRSVARPDVRGTGLAPGALAGTSRRSVTA